MEARKSATLWSDEQHRGREAPPSRGANISACRLRVKRTIKTCVDDVAQYRPYLTPGAQQHPELFPQAMAEGYTFHDRYRSRKQGVVVRRIKLKATGEVFTLRPSFLLPYCIARTEEVEKALFLRQWGVPFDGVWPMSLGAMPCSGIGRG